MTDLANNTENKCDNNACYYDKAADSCVYPLENYNCSGSWTGDYCGAASALNYGSNNKCEYDNTSTLMQNYDDNTVTMTYSQLQELINKASDLYPSFLYYTRGNFQVNDRYYTASGKLLSQNSPDAPQVQIIPGKNIIDKYEVRYEESKQPKITYDDKSRIPYNYYYKQTPDPNVSYPYDTNKVPIKKDIKYPHFKNRYDRPIDFNGTSHTYMHPKNWRYPKRNKSNKNIPKCKKHDKNEPVYLDRNFIPLDKWDSQIGTILPKFTYEEKKHNFKS